MPRTAWGLGAAVRAKMSPECNTSGDDDNADDDADNQVSTAVALAMAGQRDGPGDGGDNSWTDGCGAVDDDGNCHTLRLRYDV